MKRAGFIPLAANGWKRDQSEIRTAWRYMAEEGLLEGMGARGVNSPDMDERHLSWFVLWAMSFGSARDALEQAKELAALPLTEIRLLADGSFRAEAMPVERMAGRNESEASVLRAASEHFNTALPSFLRTDRFAPKTAGKALKMLFAEMSGKWRAHLDYIVHIRRPSDAEFVICLAAKENNPNHPHEIVNFMSWRLRFSDRTMHGGETADSRAMRAGSIEAVAIPVMEQAQAAVGNQE